MHHSTKILIMTLFLSGSMVQLKEPLNLFIMITTQLLSLQHIPFFVQQMIQHLKPLKIMYQAEKCQTTYITHEAQVQRLTHNLNTTMSVCMMQRMGHPHQRTPHLLTVPPLEEQFSRVETLLLLYPLLHHLLYLEVHLKVPTLSSLYILCLPHHLLRLEVTTLSILCLLRIKHSF